MNISNRDNPVRFYNHKLYTLLFNPFQYLVCRFSCCPALCNFRKKYVGMLYYLVMVVTVYLNILTFVV